jgi:hypothetical protein
VQKGKKRMFVVRPAIVAALAAVIFIGRPGSARAQGSGPITLEGADYTLQMGALIQLDGRFAINDPLNAVGDTFVLRRVRPILQGRVAKFFDFRLMPDFGNGTVVLSTPTSTRDSRTRSGCASARTRRRSAWSSCKPTTACCFRNARS